MVHKGKKAYLKKQKQENEEVNKNEENNSNNKLNKKAKIIVRNLPFKNLSEESVKNFFKEYGDIVEVNLLRKEDGCFVGCGFVQFEKVSSAAKAIRFGNEKLMNGRKIVIDWALPKKTFLEKVKQLKENEYGIKSEPEVLFDIDKKPDVVLSDEEEKYKIEKEEDSDAESESDDDESDVDVKEEDEDDDSDDYYNNSDDENDKKPIGKEMNKERKPLPSDVDEGKTVFVRNIPFSAQNEDLEECFKIYGPIKYALICVDKITEHSKGTGFVKFQEKESASQCLKDSGKIFLQDNPLTVIMAISKDELENKKQSKKPVKDSRNLYLIREGLIVAGSKAAAGVSAGDMSKRLQLEQWKTQILKNLNMFVSRNRLVIHNLPPDYNDQKLKKLFQKYSDPKAVIREAKVMYDKKKMDAGKNASKEVGFVTFTKHEDALTALRNINNNPEIFTPKKRPIVAFSIENKAVINAKIKRVEKSRAKLGLLNDKPNKLLKLNSRQRRFLRRREKFIERRKEKQKSRKGDEEGNQENAEVGKKRKNTDDSKPTKKQKVANENGEESKPYTGIISKSGGKIKLRSKFKLKNQAQIHSQTLKEERVKRREKLKKSLIKPSKGKSGAKKPKKPDDKKLSNLIEKHRESIQQSSTVRKWYDK